MKELNIYDFCENIFKDIDKDWMLISAYDGKKDDKKYNTMTASWGGFGVLWHKNVAWCVIRDSRYTKEFADRSDKISFSFFDEQYKSALVHCGRVSGRDEDKIKNAGLSVSIEDGAVIFNEARLTFVGKKLYAQRFDKDCFVNSELFSENYPTDDLHTIYFCEIEKILQK